MKLATTAVNEEKNKTLNMQASHNHAEGTAMPYPLLISQTSHQWGLFITTPRLVELFGKAICRAVLAKEIPIFIPCSSTDSESRSPQWAPGLAEVARQKAILPSTSKASLCRPFATPCQEFTQSIKGRNQDCRMWTRRDQRTSPPNLSISS